MHPFRFLFTSLVTVVGLTLNVRLPAQTAATPAPANTPPSEEPVKLSVFSVNTTRDVGYQSMNAAQATRMNTPIENLPMDVSIYNKQFIDDLLLTTSEGLLEYDSSAVKLTENDAFTLRGQSSVNSNSLNGFAQTAGGGGSQPLANVERMEVIQGPASVLYGAGGYGGVFNRVTKQPLPNPFTTARVILREQNSYRAEFDYGGSIPIFGGKKFLYRFNGVLENSSSYNGIPRSELALAPSLAWNIGKDTKIVFEYFRHQFVRQGNWEFPVVNGDINGITDAGGHYHAYGKHKWNWGLPSDERRTVRNVASYDLQHAFSRNILFRSQFQVEYNRLKNVETTPENLGVTLLKDAVVMGRYWRIVPNETDNFRSRNELIALFGTGPVKHRFLFGHGWAESYNRTRTDRTQSNYGGLAAGSAALEGDGRTASTGRAFNSFPDLTLADLIANPKLGGFNPNLIQPVNVFDPTLSPSVPELAFRPTLYPSAFTKTFNATNDFYANDLLSVAEDRLFVMVGGRRVNVHQRTINYLSGAFPFAQILPSPATVRRSSDADTYSAGVAWQLNRAKTLTLYGNYNKAFTPTLQVQPDGSLLDPEQATQKEYGLRFSFLEGRMIGLVSHFDILQDKVVVSDPARLGYFLQLSGLHSKGEKFTLNTRITNQWYLMGGFTQVSSQQERSGTRLAQQPKNKVTLVNRYAPSSGILKGFSFVLGVIYTGDRPVAAITTPRVAPAFTIPSSLKIDAVVNYEFRTAGSRYKWNVGAKVNNVLDRTIIYSGTGSRFSTDPGRTVEMVTGVAF